MRLLVVEDSKFTRQLICNQIKALSTELDLNLELDSAENGLQGLEMHQLNPYDAIVTDLLMPLMQGDEMIRQIRGFDQVTKIVVLTADVQKAVQDELKAIGITAFINKPFNGDKAKYIVQLLEEQNHVE